MTGKIEGTTQAGAHTGGKESVVQLERAGAQEREGGSEPSGMEENVSASLNDREGGVEEGEGIRASSSTLVTRQENEGKERGAMPLKGQGKEGEGEEEDDSSVQIHEVPPELVPPPLSVYNSDPLAIEGYLAVDQRVPERGEQKGGGSEGLGESCGGKAGNRGELGREEGEVVKEEGGQGEGSQVQGYREASAKVSDRKKKVCVCVWVGGCVCVGVCVGVCGLWWEFMCGCRDACPKYPESDRSVVTCLG